jgi:hypothetical protein
MTKEFDGFLELEKQILDWMSAATTDKDRRAAGTALQNLHKARTEQVTMGSIMEATTPAPRKPRKKLTTIEKYDKKNSRREAIMAQRAKRA